jgi:hypothetical protein
MDLQAHTRELTCKGKERALESASVMGQKSTETASAADGILFASRARDSTHAP